MKQLEGVREDEQLEKTSDRECLHEEKVVENLVEFDVKTQKLPNKNKTPNTHTHKHTDIDEMFVRKMFW